MPRPIWSRPGRAVGVPAHLSLEIAAAGLLKGMTAEFLVRRACRPVKAGDTILIHAAAGGVGTILVQWAKALGARVIGVVGSEAKAVLARSLGCDEVVLYGQEDVAARVREITGGRASTSPTIRSARTPSRPPSPAWRGAACSSASATPRDRFRRLRAPAADAGGSLFFTRPTLADYVATSRELDDSAGVLFAMLGAGRLKIEIGQTFPLAEAAGAHEALEGRRTWGATLLIP